MEILLEELTGGLRDSAEFTRFVIRLVAAMALGAIVGYERERAGKAAGLRTHMLVAMGSALFETIKKMPPRRNPKPPCSKLKRDAAQSEWAQASARFQDLCGLAGVDDVSDDFLVHFDDERATHALRALQEMSNKCQVLMGETHRRRCAMPFARGCAWGVDSASSGGTPTQGIRWVYRGNIRAKLNLSSIGELNKRAAVWVE